MCTFCSMATVTHLLFFLPFFHRKIERLWPGWQSALYDQRFLLKSVDEELRYRVCSIKDHSCSTRNCTKIDVVLIEPIARVSHLTIRNGAVSAIFGNRNRRRRRDSSSYLNLCICSASPPDVTFCTCLFQPLQSFPIWGNHFLDLLPVRKNLFISFISH